MLQVKFFFAGVDGNLRTDGEAVATILPRYNLEPVVIFLVLLVVAVNHLRSVHIIYHQVKFAIVFQVAITLPVVKTA